LSRRGGNCAFFSTPIIFSKLKAYLVIKKIVRRLFRKTPDVMGHFDQPRSAADLRGRFTIAVSGWLAAKNIVKPLRLEINGVSVPYETVDRPDVAAQLKNNLRSVTGFKIEIPAETLCGQSVFTANFGGVTTTLALDENFETTLRTMQEAQQEKRSFILKNLICPECRGDIHPASAQVLRCATCQNVYGFENDTPILLSGVIREKSAIRETENISSHGYDPLIQKQLAENPEKMFLDAGAGFRSFYYPNVVNLEICNYRSTDIVASGQFIPFKDETFDGVISVAVMEHVPNFFEYADNILRVVKPGGWIFCAVPFLQPEHGYPDHYYNMTSEGLLNIFRKRVDFVEKGFIDHSMHPLLSLKWILDLYEPALTDPKTRAAFGKMKVSHLVRMSPEDTQTLIKTHRLETETYRRICHGSYFIGNKSS
jgi:SAM-dependent methyltransferase